jgi:hypothetical protein
MNNIINQLIKKLYGPYASYAILQGEHNLEEATDFHNWVHENPKYKDAFSLPGLYDLWLGVPLELIEREENDRA